MPYVDSSCSCFCYCCCDCLLSSQPDCLHHRREIAPAFQTPHPSTPVSQATRPPATAHAQCLSGSLHSAICGTLAARWSQPGAHRRGEAMRPVGKAAAASCAPPMNRDGTTHRQLCEAWAAKHPRHPRHTHHCPHPQPCWAQRLCWYQQRCGQPPCLLPCALNQRQEATCC